MIYIGNHENAPIKLITEVNIGDYETGGGSKPGGGTEPGEDLPGTGTRPERPNAQLPHYRDMVVGNTINWFNKDYLIVDMSDEVAVLVNSLGGTPLEELYILYSEVQKLLDQYNIRIYKPYIGRYACSMEMHGASLSLLRLDAELKELLDAPAETPFFIQK